MQVHNLVQGSQEWHAYRANHFNASDAPAMMGCSPYKKRAELLKEYATGTSKEISATTQALFDEGHRFEALARKLAEEIINDDLYPVTGSLGKLSASFDGLTMDHMVDYEHKSMNAEIRAATSAAELGLHLRVQMEQQLYISGAEECLFVASKWDNEGKLIESKNFVYKPDLELRAKIIAGWEQFERDLEKYAHVEVLPAATATPVIALPSLSIQVIGEISLNSNLVPFGDRLTAFIESIVKEPKTDQDFADADAAVKTLQKAQDALEQAESSALAQTASIDEMRGTVKLYADLARNTRLQLEKLVKARKETIRIEIQQEAKAKADAHIAALNAQIGKPYMPLIVADFAGVMKAKKTISSLRDAVDTELANFKIKADAVCKTIMFNITTLRELAVNHAFLFADASQIVLKATDDCTTLIKMRISEHNLAEAKRLETERAVIAEEERIKAEAKVRAEQAAIAHEEAVRLHAEEKVRQQEAASLAQEQATRAAAQQAAEYTPPLSLQEVMTACAPKEITQALFPGEVHQFPKASEPHQVESLPTGQPATSRPTDAQIVEVLSLHFRVHESLVISWLSDIDLPELNNQLAAEFH